MTLFKQILILIFFIFTGCYDKFYGPKIKNTFDENLEIEIFFKDGTIKKGKLYPKSCTLIGKSDKSKDEIIKIRFFIAGELNYVLNENEIRKLKVDEINEKLSNPAWHISKNDVVIKQCTYK